MLYPRSYPADYAGLLKLSRSLDSAADRPQIRIALLSDAATQRLVPLLRALFHAHGLEAVCYEGPFDAVRVEAIDPNSGVYRFRPDLVYILNSTQALRARFAGRTGSAEAFYQEEAAALTAVWDAIQQNSAATIVQSDYVSPVERTFGNFERRTPESLTSVVSRLNDHIAREASARKGILLNAVDSVASWVGRREWFDERFWDIAKYFCHLECLPALARNMVDIALALRGRVVKCVVLDLDNTLWGGVIGDDGVDGIVLNAHGDGEGFWRFQTFLRELRRRGILLAVCSKNEMSNALLPFEKHPDMVLQRSDIAVFVANWNDKAENIRRIREELNIGFDSMVFLDDNPFERDLVRGVLPDVMIPDLPEDPADYVRAICELNLFETSSFSSEDAGRAEMYRAEAERREAQAAFANADDFLRSLDMRIQVARFDAFHLPRIAQLIQRSNQFNLTTHRYTEAECGALMNDPGVLPLYARLRDRMGDHGLIGLIVLEPSGDALLIRDWLMSCRVLARGVEQYLMNLCVEEARSRGLQWLRGEFIRTAKNQLVEEFYPKFGFTADGGTKDHSWWRLDVSQWQPATAWIQPDSAPVQA